MSRNQIQWALTLSKESVSEPLDHKESRTHNRLWPISRGDTFRWCIYLYASSISRNTWDQKEYAIKPHGNKKKAAIYQFLEKLARDTQSRPRPSTKSASSNKVHCKFFPKTINLQRIKSINTQSLAATVDVIERAGYIYIYPAHPLSSGTNSVWTRSNKERGRRRRRRQSIKWWFNQETNRPSEREKDISEWFFQNIPRGGGAKSTGEKLWNGWSKPSGSGNLKEDETLPKKSFIVHVTDVLLIQRRRWRFDKDDDKVVDDDDVGGQQSTCTAVVEL